MPSSAAASMCSMKTRGGLGRHSSATWGPGRASVCEAAAGARTLLQAGMLPAMRRTGTRSSLSCGACRKVKPAQTRTITSDTSPVRHSLPASSFSTFTTPPRNGWTADSSTCSIDNGMESTTKIFPRASMVLERRIIIIVDLNLLRPQSRHMQSRKLRTERPRIRMGRGRARCEARTLGSVGHCKQTGNNGRPLLLVTWRRAARAPAAAGRRRTHGAAAACGPC